jgi:hypothetical protein
VAIVAGPAVISLDRQSQRDAAPGPDALRVEAVVQTVDAGSVGVAYDNPLTGQRVETSAPVGGRIDIPAKAARVGVAVDRADPENVRLAGHRPAPGFEGLALALLLGLPLLWCAIRWWSVRAAERLAGRPAAPTFAMVGALAAPRRAGRRLCLHLWPLDSPPGAEALCAVPLLVSGGLPVGAAFPVEVKGSPRSFGRVVARAGDTVLWPAARTLRAPWLRRPAQVEAAPMTLGPPLTAEMGDTLPPAIGFLAVHAQVFLGLGGSLVLLLAVGSVTLINRGHADDLYRNGREVIAEVTERGGTSVTVRYTMPGETTARTGRVPVDRPGDQKIGLKLPAVADPVEGAPLRFLRERYDAGEPIMWAAFPAVMMAGLLLAQLRTWRASARVATRGPWRVVTARRRGGSQLTYLALSSGAETATALEVRIPFASTGPLGARLGGPPIRLEMAGDPDPGSPIALRHSGRLLPVSSPARVPRSDRRIPLPRRWPARRPGTDPAAS